ncbi:PKD domain-containing protein [Daejeonella sp. H1SJ63]|uniref:PKD domain-containing protein n=1 Tax=Daejeonella sp. H1SJ63 TaxID=3034145 RepID=UPI0023ED9268|nr:PKD domain-containing protein [Daejeonella sp. H1SJ63]
MFRKLGLICFLILSLILFCKGKVSAQSTSNEGTEFWAAFPTHMPGGNFRDGILIQSFPAKYSVFITGSQPSSGVVSVGSWSQSFNLSVANTVIEIEVPRSEAYINESEAGRILTNRGIKILVDPGKPKVVVYGHIFAGRRSAASLILPKESIGQRYYSMNQEVGIPDDGGKNHIVIVATEPDTRVFIQNGGRDLVPGGILLNNPGDVYEYLSQNDLTGTKVFVDPNSSACKRFVLFSGTTNSTMTVPTGCGQISSDPLYQQNYPVESWGSKYGFIPFSSRSRSGAAVRTRGNFLRILAKENNTVVNFNGSQITLNEGQYYQSPNPLNTPAYISSDKAVAVAQYSLTQSCAGGGFSDPDMVILNPVEYNIRNITVYSSDKENISENYVNILINTSAAASFRINGKAPTANFIPLPSSPGMSYLQLNLNQYSSQIFNLFASEGFNAIAYGFGDVESYAYSAGTNLASAQYVRAINKITLEEITSACTNQDMNFKLTLTAPASSLSWQLDTNDTPVIQSNPAYTTVVRSGISYYEYLFPRNLGYNQAGKKIIKVIARFASAAGCTLDEQQIDYALDIYNPPVPAFTSTVNYCENAEISFTDQSNDNGNPLTSWLWDFGDGTSSTEQNPKHIYARAGQYTVILKIQNSTSCNVQELPKTIQLKEAPAADFEMSKPGCNNSSISFTDRSTTIQGRIVKWKWNFGDGNVSEQTNSSPVNHQYTAGGTYKVSLTVSNESGCEQTLIKELSISTPFLNVGRDTVILRGGMLGFNILATGTNLKYKWSPSTGLDRDDVRNPVASPQVDTRYTVTITSDEGCVLTDDILVKVLEMPVIPNTFSPNGDGINDVWNIQYLDSYPGVIVSIYNRYGIKVYGSIGYLNPWNAISSGVQVPVGIYYYLIEPKSGLPSFKGWVTIIR